MGSKCMYTHINDDNKYDDQPQNLESIPTIEDFSNTAGIDAEGGEHREAHGRSPLLEYSEGGGVDQVIDDETVKLATGAKTWAKVAAFETGNKTKSVFLGSANKLP